MRFQEIKKECQNDQILTEQKNLSNRIRLGARGSYKKENYARGGWKKQGEKRRRERPLGRDEEKRTKRVTSKQNKGFLLITRAREVRAHKEREKTR